MSLGLPFIVVVVVEEGVEVDEEVVTVGEVDLRREGLVEAGEGVEGAAVMVDVVLIMAAVVVVVIIMIQVMVEEEEEEDIIRIINE